MAQIDSALPLSSSLSEHYANLCASTAHNKLLRPVKPSRSLMGMLDTLEAEAAAVVASSNTNERGTMSSNTTRALFGQCCVSELPIIGSVCRYEIIRAAAEANVPTVSSNTDYRLDLGAKAYTGSAGCVVLCEALLTYMPKYLISSALSEPNNSSIAEQARGAESRVEAAGASAQVQVAHAATERLGIARAPAFYCALKELRLSGCGLDTNAAYALFRLLTHDRCAYTLKVLDVSNNPFLAIEAGQLFLGALGYTQKSDDDVSGGELLSLLRALQGQTDDQHGEAFIPNMLQNSLGTRTEELARIDIGTQTAAEIASLPPQGDGEIAGEAAESPTDVAAVIVEAHKLQREAQLRREGFRARPRLPNRHISLLCHLYMDGTNIPTIYQKRLEVLCKQNRHL